METKRLQMTCDKCKVKIPCVLILDKPVKATDGTFSKIKYQDLIVGYFLCKDCAKNEEEGGLRYE